MIDLLFVTLFQAVAGAPAVEQPTEPAAAQTETQQQANAEEAEPRRCRQRRITGTRLSSLVTCRRGNVQQDQETRDAMRYLQRSGGTNGS
ncbi:MAG: hypothetical protein GC206_14160 [Alphaproteobacteria bacterium]|nr:hypothetical protein [Alphaproteobacteria bacterium]